LTNGTTYYYKITALNSDDEESAATSAVSAAPAASSGGGGVSISFIQQMQEQEQEQEQEEEQEEEQTQEEEQEQEGLQIPTIDKPLAEMTVEELLTKIQEFQQAITQLQQMISELVPVDISGIPAGYKFEGVLEMGAKSEAIKYLQILLNSDEDTRLAETGPGSPGNETTYFGPLTKQAVIRFQEKYGEDILSPWGLSKGTGKVAQTTRAKLNEILGIDSN